MFYSQIKSNCFQKTTICETGLSDFHNFVITIFRSTVHL